MKNKVSPLKPKLKTNPNKIAGVTMATAASGIKYKNRDDLLLFCFSPKTNVAGVFTKSTTASPAVYWCKNVLKDGKALAIIVNAGIANVFTGEIGKKLVSNIAKNVSTVLNINPKEVLIAQTGVIGEYFPKEKITSQLRSHSYSGVLKLEKSFIASDIQAESLAPKNKPNLSAEGAWTLAMTIPALSPAPDAEKTAISTSNQT